MKLHPYQEIAVLHLKANPRAALFLDMGLGKTAATLSALEPRHLPALVVAPPRVAEYVWPAEVELWRPDLSLELARGGPSARRNALASGADIVAIGRDVLADAQGGPWKTVIIDELSGFKSRTSKRFKSAKALIWGKGSSVEYVWGLTGTPMPNGLMDLWAQVSLLDGGQRLERGITRYRERYFTPGRRMPYNNVVTEWLPKPGAEEKIHSAIDDICLSMGTDGRIELPPVTYNTVDVPLDSRTTKMYRTMARNLVLDLAVLDGEVHTAATAAVLSNRLSQLTAGFMYVDDADLRNGQYDVVHQSKVDALREVIEGTGGNVLVFYRFKAERDAIMAALPQAVPLEAERAIDRWNDGQVPVLLAHPASAGHGLNLQRGGHTIVWTSLTWSLEEWLQANKRLARQGQQHPVIIHTLSAPGTIDEAIALRLVDKKLAQDALLSHLECFL